jgi:hypothetical protein
MEQVVVVVAQVVQALTEAKMLKAVLAQAMVELD